jgi:hypothetical protein
VDIHLPNFPLDINCKSHFPNRVVFLDGNLTLSFPHRFWRHRGESSGGFSALSGEITFHFSVARLCHCPQIDCIRCPQPLSHGLNARPEYVYVYSVPILDADLPALIPLRPWSTGAFLNSRLLVTALLQVGAVFMQMSPAAIQITSMLIGSARREVAKSNGNGAKHADRTDFV